MYLVLYLLLLVRCMQAGASGAVTTVQQASTVSRPMLEPVSMSSCRDREDGDSLSSDSGRGPSEEEFRANSLQLHALSQQRRHDQTVPRCRPSFHDGM